VRYPATPPPLTPGRGPFCGVFYGCFLLFFIKIIKFFTSKKFFSSISDSVRRDPVEFFFVSVAFEEKNDFDV